MNKLRLSFAALGIVSSMLIAGCNDSDDSSNNNPVVDGTPPAETTPTVPQTTLEKVIAKPADVLWNRIRPLDLNPENNSGIALNRPCIPTESLIYNGASLTATQDPRYTLEQGDFVICVDNTADQVIVADSKGWEYTISQNNVNATKNFPSSWLAFDREFVIWAYDRDTIIFRDAMHNSFEGNFFYLLLGRDNADNVTAGMLVDSGAGFSNLAPYIHAVMGDKPLTVVNTHSHWDHFGGNTYLNFLPNVKFYGYQPGTEYNPYPTYPQYNLEGLFDQSLALDVDQGEKTLMVGNRAITAMLDPGHTADTVILYDTQAKLLFTSDSVCNCGAFIEYWPEYRKTLEKLTDFTLNHDVKWALGSHLEFSKKRSWNNLHEYFLFGSNTHVDEEVLQVAPSEIPKNLEQVLRYEAKQGNTTNPSYDAHEIDKLYHERPYTVIPFPNIAKYFGPSDRNMSGKVKANQVAFLESLK